MRGHTSLLGNRHRLVEIAIVNISNTYLVSFNHRPHEALAILGLGRIYKARTQAVRLGAKIQPENLDSQRGYDCTGSHFAGQENVKIVAAGTCR